MDQSFEADSGLQKDDARTAERAAERGRRARNLEARELAATLRWCSHVWAGPHVDYDNPSAVSEYDRHMSELERALQDFDRSARQRSAGPMVLAAGASHEQRIERQLGEARARRIAEATARGEEYVPPETLEPEPEPQPTTARDAREIVGPAIEAANGALDARSATRVGAAARLQAALEDFEAVNPSWDRGMPDHERWWRRPVAAPQSDDETKQTRRRTRPEHKALVAFLEALGTAVGGAAFKIDGALCRATGKAARKTAKWAAEKFKWCADNKLILEATEGGGWMWLDRAEVKTTIDHNDATPTPADCVRWRAGMTGRITAGSSEHADILRGHAARVKVRQYDWAD